MKVVSHAVAAAMSLAAAVLAQAQSPAAIGVRSATLSNGLEVIVVPNPTIPQVSMQMVIRGGAAVQTSPDLEGLPHLLEHLLFRGDDTDGWSFGAEADKIEASWNGSTTPESVNYMMTFPSKHLDKGMQLLADLVRKPEINVKAIEAEAKVVRGEMERRAAEPALLMRIEADMLLWEGSAWSMKNPGGTLFAIQKAKPEQLAAMHRRFYVPNNAALVIAGDVTDTVVFRLAEKHFKSWKRTDDPLAGVPPVRGTTDRHQAEVHDW